MARASTQHKLDRVRPPRVHITYDVEIGDAIEMKEALLRGQVQQMTSILNRSWNAKKLTAEEISTSRIEELMEVEKVVKHASAAKESGATRFRRAAQTPAGRR